MTGLITYSRAGEGSRDILRRETKCSLYPWGKTREEDSSPAVHGKGQRRRSQFVMHAERSEKENPAYHAWQRPKEATESTKEENPESYMAMV